MLVILCDGLVIGISAAFLWFFSNIWRYRVIIIQEKDYLVLSLETILLIGIFFFGLVKLVYDLRSLPDR